jgi:hypothetical protein
MKRVLAVLAGLVVAVLVIFVGELVQGVLYPAPDGFDFRDRAQVEALAKSIPPLALVLVLLAAFLGAFIGGMIATIIMKTNDKVAALIVGAVLTILGIINLVAVPHPIWFIIPALLVYFAGAYLGMMIYSRFKKKKDA